MSRILLIGAGDLARRIAALLAGRQDVSEIVLAVRTPRAVSPLVASLTAAGGATIRATPLDALDADACAALLHAERPDVVVQCACLVSPWLVAAAPTRQLQELGPVGFALQLPFQLAIVHSVMRGVRACGFAGPVVNCSYPDATNPVLAAVDLAPTTGIGNVDMMRVRVEAALRARGTDPGLVRMVAHHALTVPVFVGARTPADESPIVCLGDEGIIRNELAWCGPPIAWSRESNAVTAAVAVPVICALMRGGPELRASLPGPLGLPGGYPVRVSHAGVTLDLPPTVALADAIERNVVMGRRDGVERIEHDGTVVFTAGLAGRLAAFDAECARPLRPGEIMPRAHRLAAALGLA